jgi:uncharacterized repeat protein (TIGR01451 family)
MKVFADENLVRDEGSDLEVNSEPQESENIEQSQEVQDDKVSDGGTATKQEEDSGDNVGIEEQQPKLEGDMDSKGEEDSIEGSAPKENEAPKPSDISEENAPSEQETEEKPTILDSFKSKESVDSGLMTISQKLLMDKAKDTAIGKNIKKGQIIKAKIDFGASGDFAFYNTKIKYTLPVGAKCLEIITPAYVKPLSQAKDVKRDIIFKVEDAQGKLEPGTNGNIYIRFSIPEIGKASPYPNGKIIKFEDNATIIGYKGSTGGELVEVKALGTSIKYSLPATWKIEKTGPANVTISNNTNKSEVILDYNIKLSGGDIDLKDVTIVDTLPNDAEPLEYPGGTVDNNTVKWTFDDIKAGTKKDMSLKIRLPIEGRGGNTEGIVVSNVKDDSRTNSVKVTGYPIDTEDDGSSDGNKIKYKNKYVFKDSQDEVTTNFKLSSAEWGMTITHTDDGSEERTIKLSKNDEDTYVDVKYKIGVAGGEIDLESGEIRYEIPNNATIIARDGGEQKTIEDKEFIVWSGVDISANASVEKNITARYSIYRGSGTGVKDKDIRENHANLYTKNESYTLLDSDTATTKFEDSDVEWRISKIVNETKYTIPDDDTEETQPLNYTIKVSGIDDEAKYNIPLKTLTVKDTLAPGAKLNEDSISSNPSVNYTINGNIITWTFRDIQPTTSPTMSYKVIYPIKRGKNSGDVNAIDTDHSNTKENIAYVTEATTKNGDYVFKTGYARATSTTTFNSPGAPKPHLNIYIDGTKKDRKGTVIDKHYDKGDKVTYSIDLNNNKHNGHNLKNAELIFDNYDESDSTLKKKLDITKIITAMGNKNEEENKLVKYKLWYKTEGASDFTLYDHELNMNTQTEITSDQITNIGDITEFKFVFSGQIPKSFTLSNKFEIEGIIKDAVAYNTEIKNAVSLEGDYQSFNSLKAFSKVTSHIKLKIYLDTAWISTFKKEVQNFKSKGYNNTENVDFVITLANHNKFATSPLEEPTIIDILPEGFEFISWNDDSWDTDNSSIDKPNLQKIEDYPARGQTTLVWSWANYDLLEGKTAKIKFRIKILEHVSAGRQHNEIYLMANGGYRWKGDIPSLEDSNDIDDDTNITEKYIQGDGAYVDVIKSGSTRTTKYIMGELDREDFQYEKDGVIIKGKGFQYEDENGNPIYGKSTPGGAADYSIRVKNIGNIPIKELVLVDILPFVGDTYVKREEQRDSEWTPYLIEAIKAGKLSIVKDVYKGEDESSSAYDKYANVKVFYSQAKDPKRNISGNTLGTQEPQWNETPPEDITSVRSLKFEIKFYDRDDKADDYLQPGSTVRIDLKMRAPIGTPVEGAEEDRIAWNSVLTDALSYYIDNDEPLSIVEPRKVGMIVESNPLGAIGDFVWFDKNGNGIQDDGYDEEKAGINGIKVKLYKLVSDKWEHRATTVTGNNYEGKPGYYLFPAIETGTYYVTFDIPSYYDMTEYEKGNDDTKDSDVYKEGSIFRTRNIDIVTYGDHSKKYNYDLDLGLKNVDTPEVKPPNVELAKNATGYKKKGSDKEIKFTPGNKFVNVDDTIIYKISIKNTGGIPLNNIKLADTLEARELEFKWANFTDENSKEIVYPKLSDDSNIIYSSEKNGLRIRKLLPKQSYDIYTEYRVKEVEPNNSSLVNTVKVWANELRHQDEKNNPYDEKSDSVDIADMEIEKRIASIKKADGTSLLDIDYDTVGVETGDTIKYEIKVTNTGSFPLSNIRVTDPRVGLDKIIATEGTIAPGNNKILMVEYKVKPSDEGSPIENIAKANDETSKVRTEKSSNKVVVYFKGIAVIKRVKSINDVEVDPKDKISGRYVVKYGDKIEYEITFTNNGDNILKDISIVEDKITSSRNSEYLSKNEKLASELSVGDSIKKTFAYTVGDKDIADDGEVTKSINNNVVGKSKYTASQKSDVDVDIAHISIKKTADKNKFKTGDEITYNIVVTNKGSVTLNNVRVKDSMLKIEKTIPTLASGEKEEIAGKYFATEADYNNGKIINTASVDSDETDEFKTECTIYKYTPPSSGGSGGSSGGGSNKDKDKDTTKKPKPESQPEPQPNPDPKPEPTPDPQPVPEPEPQPEPEPGETPEEPEETGKIIKDTEDIPTYIPPRDKEVVEIVEQPEHGTVKKDDSGNLKYIPKDGYKGPDKFKVKIKDEDGNELIIEIEIPDEDIPQGTITVLPQTGEGRHYPYYLFGLAVLLLGVFMNFKEFVKRFNL